jgi:hypothetical protein
MTLAMDEIVTFLFGLPLAPSKLQAYVRNEIILDIF